MDKKWIKFEGLDKIKHLGTRMVVVLLENKSGSRILDIVVNTYTGRYKLLHPHKKEWTAIGYYEIDEWTYCNKPYGEDIPGLSTSTCEIFALWGYKRNGAFPIRDQIVKVRESKPHFCAECEGDTCPDILVAYHELPNMYDEEFLNMED